jgi:hypothetical protein
MEIIDNSINGNVINGNVISCNIIQILQDYMLTENNIQRSIENMMETNNSKKNIHKNEKNDSKNKYDFFIPLQKDKLFWCFFIIKNGDVKYELLGKINTVIEKNIKIEYIEKIRKEKQLLKIYKFASLSNIENQLANEFKIDLNTFFILCVIENINILYINKKTYFELLMNDTHEIFIIKNFDNEKFGYKVLSINDTELKNYRDTLLKIDNIDKPLKSLSSYKVQELLEFANKLAIETTNIKNGKKKTKNELYESILQYF